MVPISIAFSGERCNTRICANTSLAARCDDVLRLKEITVINLFRCFHNIPMIRNPKRCHTANPDRIKDGYREKIGLRFHE